MDQLDREWVLKGHIPLQHAGDIIGLSHPEFRTWFNVLNEHSDHLISNSSVFELYRIDLVRQLLALGYSKDEIKDLSLDIQRSIIRNLTQKSTEDFDFSALLDASERLDRQACADLFAKELKKRGLTGFALEFAPALMLEVGKRWWHGRTAVFQEHFVTTVLRNHLGAAAIEQREHLRPALRVIVTTPHGELHEIGAILASISAHDSGHEAIFLGSQLPVAEIMQAVDVCSAHVVCLASSSLELRRLSAQVFQLREVLPSHVVLCIGGRSFDDHQFANLHSTLVYDDLSTFDADMRAFARFVSDWLPR